MSNMFWPTWVIELFAKNVAIMGPGYVDPCAQECLISPQMSNQLKMAEPRFPVTHGIMGTPLTLFKMWDFCPLQGRTHTCQRPVMVETLFLNTFASNIYVKKVPADVCCWENEFIFYQGCSFRCITTRENWPSENLNKMDAQTPAITLNHNT